MHRHPHPARPHPSKVLAAAAGALLVAASGAWLGGCDNPACIYSGDCNSDGDGGGNGGGTTDPTSSGVIFPVDGEWIVSGAPEFDAVFPEDEANTTTPILLFASESLNPASISGAFRLVIDDDTGTGSGASLSATLVGDGRVLLLRPMGPLMPGTPYRIEFGASAVVRDLTGVALVKPVSNLVGTFSVQTQPASSPQLVASWPPDGATNQSAIGEIVVAFDRPMNADTIDAGSFVVTVDGAAVTPTIAPQVLRPGGGAPESRVYTWRRVDAAGNALALPAGGAVRVELSPAGDAIMDLTGTAFANTVIEFQIAPFSPPASAAILTDPSDAIGIEHLVGAMPLMIEVTLAEAAQEGDVLGIELFGIGVESGLNAHLPRSVTLAAGSTSAVLGPADLGLVTTPDPLQAVFADGEIGFAFRVQRASATSPVRLLDVDSAAGVQDPMLDTVAPEFEAFGSQGNDTNQFRSDLYELAVIGRASEELRSVEVTATVEVDGTPQTFTNGQLPPLPGSESEEGLFVAAPIPGETFAAAEGAAVQLGVRLYDRALNPSADVAAFYQRRGIVGGGVPPLSMITLRAYDATTILGVPGARVFLHVLSTSSGSGVGGPATVVHALGPFFTGSDGNVSIAVPPVGELLFSVDADGYDLFSIQGVRARLIDVPLVVTPLPTALIRQAITSSLEELDALERVGADSRRAVLGRSPVLEMTCTTDPFTNAITCITLPDLELGGYLVPAGRTGAFTFEAIETPSAPQLFDAEDYLRAFLFLYPRPALDASDMALSATAPLQGFLADLDDPEEDALAAPPFQLDAANVTGLTSDPVPRVRVESRSPGVADPVLTGFGTPFDLDGNLVWDVLSAYPGAVDTLSGTGDALGRLVESGTVGPELRIAVELADEAGNRTTVRTVVAGTPPAGPIVPADVPEVLAPTTGTGGASFDVVLAQVLATDAPGIYSATLSEFFPQTGGGRSWRLWRVRAAGVAASELRLRVPNIAALGGTPLGSAQLFVRGDVRSYPSFDAASFAWSELDRRAERSAASAPRLVTNP